LPAVQPGSSMMPGKINPVMCEMLNMVCFQVIGCDETVAWAAAAGQLELNVMLPVMAHNLLESMALLQGAVAAFSGRGLRGIRADAARCRLYFERNPTLATALAPILGYAKAAEMAKESIRTGRTIAALAIESGLMTREEIRRTLDPGRLTRPGILKPRGVRRRGRGPSGSGRSRRD